MLDRNLIFVVKITSKSIGRQNWHMSIMSMRFQCPSLHTDCMHNLADLVAILRTYLQINTQNYILYSLTEINVRKNINKYIKNIQMCGQYSFYHHEKWNKGAMFKFQLILFRLLRADFWKRHEAIQLKLDRDLLI